MKITGTLFEGLLDMRKWFGQEFNPHLPEPRLSRLAGYIDGYLTARNRFGSPDVLANEFIAWLRERGDHPPDGWEGKLRRDLDGDEQVAVGKFLDLAAEFIRFKALDFA
jgi:hypothetical protein